MRAPLVAALVLLLAAPSAVAPHEGGAYKNGVVVTHDGPVPATIAWETGCDGPGWARIAMLVGQTLVVEQLDVAVDVLAAAGPGGPQACLYGPEAPLAIAGAFRLTSAATDTEIAASWQAQPPFIAVAFAGTYRSQPASFVTVLHLR